ncbi:hypothetical protein [Mucilaginibacter hurinus]|nr:hypothetical protein [Mucilaginibacter hurinus]
MKKLNLLLITMVMFSLGGCSVVGDIFKAGYYVGIIVVVVVLLLLWWVVSLFRKG